MAKAIDITNKKFNNLTAIRFIETRKHGTSQDFHYWEFKCDCDSIKILRKTSVTTGQIKSCGCLQKINHFKKPKGEASFNHKYNTYKARANKLNLDFELSKEYFRELTQLNCYYCNSAPSNRHLQRNFNGEYIYNGIDRMNNSQCYTKENAIPCCKVCNRAKSDMSEREFKEWVDRIYHHWSLEEIAQWV